MEEDRGERACLYEASHACRAVLCHRDNGCRWLAAADVARPVTDACERAHPPMESISAAWQGLTHTDGPDLSTETKTKTHTSGKKQAEFAERCKGAI